jgi:uncharacterized delta-60 repeat protein
MLDIARNFAKTKLTASALDSDTTLTVADGSVFGATPFNLVIFDGTDPVQAFEDGDLEIVRCTNVATNTLTVVRAQEDTTAIALGIDYTVFQGLTARAYNDGQKRFSLMAENVDTVANGEVGDVKVLYENLVILGGLNPNANNNVWSIATQSDGKILIGGQFTTIGGTARVSVARLNTDGTLDTGFVNLNVNSAVYKVVIQSDGKIVIGGNFTTVSGTARNYIARLNSDGTLDTGFNPNANNTVEAITIQSDGKIVIGGTFTTVDGTTRNRIARLNTDGTLDTGFVDSNANQVVQAFAIQSDDKILVGGAFSTVDGTTRNGMALLNTDGTLDSGFNPNLGPQFGRPYDIVIQADGKIVIGGTFTTVGGTTRNRIARLNTDGTLDTGYNPNLSNTVYAVTIDSNGKILIGGAFITVGGVSHTFIARLNTDGTLDASINPSPSAQVRAVAIQSDGKILVGGDFTTIGGLTRNRIARIEFGDFYGLYVYTTSWKLLTPQVL